MANVRKAILAASGTPQPSDPWALDPGHMRLYRFYKPSLEPGLYGIEAKQTVKTSIAGQPDSSLTVFNYETSQATNLGSDPDNPNAPTLLQQFNVIAPQFSIDPKLVNSVYPPPGHADEGRVLPHIVFNDPHLPWERDIQVNSDVQINLPPPPPPKDGPPKLVGPILGSSVASAVTPAGGTASSATPNPITVTPEMSTGPPPYLMPWIGLAVFSVDELTLTPQQETALGIPLPTQQPVPSNSDASKQVGAGTGHVSAPGAYAMSVADYLTKIKSRINFESVYSNGASGLAALKASTETTSIIFPEKMRAAQVFSPAIQYLHLAHVRETDVEGLPDAGASPRALFSICISRRTGPVLYGGMPKPAPITQVVHLVSLEGVDQTSMDTKNPDDRIGMVSLYSWTYLAVPPDPVNFVDIMRNLGATMQMLKPPQGALDALQASVASQTKADLKTAAQQLHDRLNRGYTISRWRTAVGQESVAYTKGPLTPLPTPWKPSVGGDWPSSSNTGKDYQILDSDLGVMDVSYSSAWQLGKLLAISDKRFNAALLRFRSLVHEGAASATNMQINGIASKAAILGNMTQSVAELGVASDGSRTPARLVLPSTDRVAPPLTHPDVAPIFKNNLIIFVDAQVAAGQSLYRGFGLGKANNSDWEVIHNWISDKLFLGGIPAQYLFPDPSVLPSEALRFFYIDDAWIDCLIDGALSVANHLEPVDDKVRRRIKDVYNVHLINKIDPAPIKPPVPRYGFVIRSQLIKVMPDLKVTVTCRKVTGTPPNTSVADDTSRKPLVRLTRLDEFTIFALLDCYPEEISHIMLIQPPHQQRYVAAASGLDSQQPDFELIQLYNVNAPQTTNWKTLTPASRYPSRDNMNKWYSSGTRCLDTISMARDIEPALVQPDTGSGGFTSGNTDSVILSLELNDPSHQLTILPPHGSTPPAAAKPDRQLWVGTDVDDPADPMPSAHPVIINTPTPPIKPPVILPPVKLPPVTVHPDPLPPVVLPRPAVVNLAATNLVLQPVAAAAAAPAPAPATHDLAPLFQLAIHPAYRGAAPRPAVAADGSKTYSSVDFLPTATTSAFDLIVSVQWANQFMPLSLLRPLVSLTVQIPTTTTSTGAAGAGVVEPLVLLPAAKTGILDARMVQNKRLLPFLSTATPAPGQGQGQGQGTLTIKLTPRTSADTSVPSRLMGDSGFRLSGARIAPIVKPVSLKVVGQAALVDRGLCSVRLVETYLLSDGTTADAVSTWDVVKREGGDVDLAGIPV